MTTAYVGNYFEQSGSITTTYYYAGGARIAMRQGITVTYLLGDHTPSAPPLRGHGVGSTSIAANGTTGALISEQRYKPWGEQRYTNGTLPTRRQFTGQLNDSEIGLYFYGARSYSAALGRFISADTIVPQANDPQSWNRYSYTRNRPLNFIDPTGHKPCDDEHDCEKPVKPKPPTCTSLTCQIITVLLGSVIPGGVDPIFTYQGYPILFGQARMGPAMSRKPEVPEELSGAKVNDLVEQLQAET